MRLIFETTTTITVFTAVVGRGPPWGALPVHHTVVLLLLITELVVHVVALRGLHQSNGSGRLSLDLLSDPLLQLLDPRLLRLNDLLRVLMYPVVGIQLFLQRDYGLVTLIQTRSQRYHYVSLLQQERLVAIDLRLFFLHLQALPLHLLELLLVLLPHNPLLFLQEGPELRRLLDFLTSD